MKEKIVHLVIDDKFIDLVIDKFDKYSSANNSYILIQRKKVKSYKYIKSDRVQQYSFLEFINHFILRKNCDILFVHCFTHLAKVCLWMLPRRIKLYCSFWGTDLYDGPNPLVHTKNLLLPITKKSYPYDFFKKSNSLFSRIKFFLMKIFQKKSLARIDYLSTILPYEYKLLINIPHFKAEQMFFSYSYFLTKADMIADLVDIEKKNVLIANSASITCNHLDIFPYLAKHSDKFGKLIIPLNYGNERYKDFIVKKGNEEFGDKFNPMLDFVPREEYKKIIAGCNLAIFGHMRQQALGNISLAIQVGCKVFLWKNNPVYSYYKQMGLTIFSIEDDLERHLIDMTPLSREEIEKNQAIIINENNLRLKKERIFINQL